MWGDAERAARLGDPVRSIASKFLPDGPGCADRTVPVLAAACEFSKQGDHKQALPLLSAVACSRLARLGPSAPTAVAVQNLAVALFYAGRATEALPHFQAALDMYAAEGTDERRRESVRESLGHTLVNLANCQTVTDYSGMAAMSTLGAAIAVFKKGRGAHDPYCEFLSKAVNALAIFT